MVFHNKIKPGSIYKKRVWYDLGYIWPRTLLNFKISVILIFVNVTKFIGSLISSVSLEKERYMYLSA